MNRPRSAGAHGDRLRAAVIGSGKVGTMHAEALATNEAVQLVAVAEPDETRRLALAARCNAQAFASWQSLCASTPLDLVTIATPDDAHVEPVVAFLESGCDVFCEKPLALHSAEAAMMVNKASQCGRSLGVDFNRRYGFAYQEAQRQLQTGTIGAPKSVHWNIVDRFPAEAVRTSPTAMLTTLLTHHFDLVRWFLGEVVQVSTFGLMDRANRLATPLSIALTCQNGTLATIHSSYQEKQSRTWESMTIVGSNGILQADDVVGNTIWRVADGNDWEISRPPLQDWSLAFWQTIPAHLAAFVCAIREKRLPPVTGADGLASLRIAEAAARSWSDQNVTEVESDQ